MPPSTRRSCQCTAETPNKVTEEIPAPSFTSPDYKLFDGRRHLAGEVLTLSGLLLSLMEHKPGLGQLL